MLSPPHTFGKFLIYIKNLPILPTVFYLSIINQIHREDESPQPPIHHLHVPVNNHAQQAHGGQKIILALGDKDHDDSKQDENK